MFLLILPLIKTENIFLSGHKNSWLVLDYEITSQAKIIVFQAFFHLFLLDRLLTTHRACVMGSLWLIGKPCILLPTRPIFWLFYWFSAADTALCNIYYVNSQPAKNARGSADPRALLFLSHTGSEKVSGRAGSKISLAHITVTGSCVSDRLMMLWVYPGSICTAIVCQVT